MRTASFKLDYVSEFIPSGYGKDMGSEGEVI